jgi:hypothetical protein
MTERLIVTGLINSTEYLQQVRPVWRQDLIVNKSLNEIAQWCISYFDKYEEAPERSIEDVYFEKKRKKEIPSALKKAIERMIEDLAYEYDESYNLRYALDQTNEYLMLRHLEEHQEQLDALMENGDVEQAKEMAANYKPPVIEAVDDLDLGKEGVLDRIEIIFKADVTPLLSYPGPLGEIFNDQMLRGRFVAMLATEKRGKSFWLLDMAIRATVARNKVAFFQAGDMTEDQQLLRVASYLSNLPTNEKYTGQVFVPHKDCLRNQVDVCDRDERRGTFGCFTGGEYDEESIRKDITRESLIEAWEDFGEDYTPCTVCEDYLDHRLGVPWLIPTEISHAVTVDEAKRAFQKRFIDKHRRFKMSTHLNDSLTVSRIRQICDRWEKDDGFIPDVIVIDYADLLVPEKFQEFRHGQNEIWKNLRALSQSRHCLVITATQADGKAYDRDLLRMNNYSEDKRKYAHVTAMYGLNQDKHGREKKMGVMRINELVKREGEFDSTSTVTVLQNLNIGRPFIDSYK